MWAQSHQNSNEVTMMKQLVAISDLDEHCP
jgi:hypothetical protein